MGHLAEDALHSTGSACCNAGCGTEAKYNIPGEPHGAYCGQHKLKDMERVNTRRCSADGCDKRASFNTAGAPLLLRLHTVSCSCSDAPGTASLDVLIWMSYLIACSRELQQALFIIFRDKGCLFCLPDCACNTLNATIE
jgi:hypothetical protein